MSSALAAMRIQRSEEPVIRPGKRGAAGRRWLRWLAVGVGLFAVLGAGLYARTATTSLKGQLFAEGVDLGAVSLVSPSQADVTLVATGYVVSRRKATLGSKFTGRLERLDVAEGQEVKQGQIVAELDVVDVEAQRHQASADVAAARARVDEARAALADVEMKANREERLRVSGAVPQADADDAEARVATARAALASASAVVAATATHIRIADAALDYTHVRAPFDGTVLRKLADVGDVVSPVNPNGGGIVSIASLSELEVEVDVAETQLYKITAGKAGARVGDVAESPAEIVLDALPDRRFRGVASGLRPTVDRAKATVTVKVRFADTPDGVLPDMGAKVSFLSRPIDQQQLAQAPKKVVPADAVVDRAGSKVVFAVDGDRARATRVTVKGPASPAYLELSDGPPVGTQVVRAPSVQLADGARVKATEK